ncbi:NAD(P)-binding protein [Pholiota conissans]|uniref:Arsenite methyltransferase n=1 Tax=Pholiota conissans TaxID=109636 RepID=A0A9P5Z2J7_9AGAR|nr:NAD(P)-binding protein [Pholiota conissans]
MPSCCQPRTTQLASNDLIDIVNSAYSARAREGVDSEYAKTVAGGLAGYTEEELNSIPEGANMGLSCGNPTAIATLKEGETVVDLGSGGGIDVFLAAAKVGPTGKAIGLDMSEDMIALARKNAAKKGLKPPHVAFAKAALTEPLPIEPDSVDCIISNCVINLLPSDGKGNLLKEVQRILKPGGRIVFSDIVARKPLSEEIKNDVVAYIGCVAGAIDVLQYTKLLENAGLSNIVFEDTKTDLSIYYNFENDQDTFPIHTTPLPSGTAPARPTYDINEWVASYRILATKAGEPPAENPPTVLLRWWDAYPVVKSSPPSITAEEVAALIREGASDPAVKAGFAVVDVRRNDHAGGHVRGSFNRHAQTFYDDLPSLFEEFKNTSKVIFYCQSSNGRGPRCAGWYQDYLDAHAGEHNSQAYVLTDGIKNWLKTFKGEEDLIDAD